MFHESVIKEVKHRPSTKTAVPNKFKTDRGILLIKLLKAQSALGLGTNFILLILQINFLLQMYHTNLLLENKTTTC